MSTTPHRQHSGQGVDATLREPGRIAYSALLTTTAVGTLSGNIMNAPLHRIQQEFNATDAEIVLAVSAFTISLAVFVPLTVWFSDRYGAMRVVIIGLIVMVAAQLLAAFSVNLEMLILMRLIQGVACSTFPPGIQRSIAALWPSKGQAAMAAWAAAIGAGQAIGPPLGGVISELFGWRSVFILQAVVCLALVFIIIGTIPKVHGHKISIHPVGMTLLMVAVAASLATVTLIGQRASPFIEILVGLVAAISIAIYALLAANSPQRLLKPGSLLEKRYIRATLSAGTAMLIMGVCLVSLPLYLGEVLGLSPAPVGLIVFAMALGMVLSGRLTALLAQRKGSRWVIQMGLIILTVSPMILGWWTSGENSVTAQLIVLVVILLVIGTGITASQSVAAFAISRSEAAKNSMAFGIHNSARFMGLAVGYAWAALVYPLGNNILLYGGVSAAAIFTLLAIVIGGPAPMIKSDET